MKRFLKIGVILVAIFMITGCVKMEVTMGINKDKSMNLEIIQAVDKSLMEGDEVNFDASSFEKAEDQGFLVRDYNDGDMQGYIVTKKFENIDKLSTEENNYVSDFSEILEKSDLYIFSIKKGFLKNTYTAKLKFSDSSMSDDFSSIMDDDSSTEEDDYTYEYNWSSDEEYTAEYSEEDLLSDDWSSGDDFSSDMDYTQMMKDMEVNFVVKLPYKVINSNATSVDNDGKQLTWNLMTHQAETMDFEFELYNMTNVYIVVGIVLVVVVLVVAVIVKKIGKGKSSGGQTMMSNNVDRQNTYTSTFNNTDYSNSFVNTNDSFNNMENSNSFITPSVNPVSTPSNTSNNMFFNSQDLDVTPTEQNTIETPSIQTPSTPLNQLNQFSVNSNDSGNISVSSEQNNNNVANSILTDLEAVNFNVTPINNIQTQPVIPEPVVQPGPVVPEPVVQPGPVVPEPVVQPGPIVPEPVVQPQSVVPEPVVQPGPVMPNQNVDVSSNKFFQDPNNL